MARERRRRAAATALALTVVILGGCATDPVADAPPGPSPTSASAPAPREAPEAPESADGVARGLVYWTSHRATTGELQLVAEPYAGAGTGRTALLDAARAVTAGTPLDPDYGSAWPRSLVVEGAKLWWDGDEGYYAVHLARATPTGRPPGMSTREAHLAIQQVVWTLRSVRGIDAPVVFRSGNAPDPVTDLLGIPATGPYDAYLAADHSGVLAKVNILHIDAPTPDGTVVVRGLAESFEATVGIDVRGPDASGLLHDSATARQCCGRLWPWRYELDTAGWGPGDYVVEATTDDPVGISGGSDGVELDTKTFTIPD